MVLGVRAEPFEQDVPRSGFRLAVLRGRATGRGQAGWTCADDGDVVARRLYPRQGIALRGTQGASSQDALAGLPAQPTRRLIVISLSS